MKHLYLTILLIPLLSHISAQTYTDYLGAGQDIGIKVTTSHEESIFKGANTINGSGLDANKFMAGRFLAQASFGGDQQEIEELAQDLDFEGWIDAQMELTPSFLIEKLWATNTRDSLLFLQYREDPERDFFGPFWVHFNYAWWDNNYKAQDQLRHRIAFALSQILVISSNSDIGAYGDGLASYYDVLTRHAFGNYKDLLLDVTLDPNMGVYLSHLNNYKSDPLAGTVPDENFAREIMQLFSIGLYELHNDGTRKTDSEGQWIPTYDNGDIRELAKVFTGLKGGDWSDLAKRKYDLDGVEVAFDTDYEGISREVPMQMDESQHESGPKTIIGDYTIPTGQTGMEDIEQAVEHIFQHPNVGPFIAYRLIQQLIKSNPSPAYVDRVATAFNDNGAGIRGDMQAVIKAILLDPEARDCAVAEDPSYGKLKEPIMRLAQAMHAIPTESGSGYYWNNGKDFFETTSQAVLGAPSVFNFYLPDHQPNGRISEAGLVAPEFQIHNSQTASGYINNAYLWLEWDVLFWDWYQETDDPSFDLSLLQPLAEDPETLINELDILLTNGRMSSETRAIIKEAMYEISPAWGPYRNLRTKLALYLTFISPDFVILK